MKGCVGSLPDCPPEFLDAIAGLEKNIKGLDLVLEGFEAFKTKYGTTDPKDRGPSGKIFELLVVEALCSAGVENVYHQASVLNVPNVRYDIVLFHPKYPTVISCKTSLRERWKQADLEGVAFKQIYRRGQSILATMSTEGYRIQEKIETGDVNGLDACVVIEKDSEKFQDMLERLAATKFTKAQPVMPVTGNLIAGKSHEN